MRINFDFVIKSTSTNKLTLANQLNISTRKLERWIHGLEPIPAKKLLELIEIYNGCSAEYLLMKG